MVAGDDDLCAIYSARTTSQVLSVYGLEEAEFYFAR
jgi:hypothetical protein